MSDETEYLRHNYLERKHRDERLQPADTGTPSEHTAARLGAVFASETPLDEALPTRPANPSEPLFEPNTIPLEPSYPRSRIVAALDACGVPEGQAEGILDVLKSFR